MKMFMYEVQFGHSRATSDAYRPSVRRFVFTTGIGRAIELATAGYPDPIVQQCILRSGGGGVILDPLALRAVPDAPGPVASSGG